MLSREAAEPACATVNVSARRAAVGGPKEMEIIDGLNPQCVTLMRLSDYKARNIPANWFQRDYLPRFQSE